MQSSNNFQSLRLSIAGILIVLSAAAFSIFSNNNYPGIGIISPDVREGIMDSTKVSKPIQPQPGSSILENSSTLQLQPAPASGQSRHNPQNQTISDLNIESPPPLP